MEKINTDYKRRTHLKKSGFHHWEEIQLSARWKPKQIELGLQNQPRINYFATLPL